jgi:hypothetical protein
MTALSKRLTILSTVQNRKEGHTETSSQPPLPFSDCTKDSIWELSAVAGSTAQRRCWGLTYGDKFERFAETGVD